MKNELGATGAIGVPGATEITGATERNRWHEAVEWHERLRTPGEADLQETMKAWLQWVADEDNRRIYDSVSGLYEDGAQTRKRPLPDPQLEAPESPDKLETWRPPWSRARARATPGRRTSISRITKLAALAAVVLVLVIVVWPVPPSVWRTETSNIRSQVHQTELGEVRHDTLADGSVVTLGAQSEISVQFSPGRRAVTLERGEAWFQVSHDTARPFVVTAGLRTITAVGTAFVVARESDHVRLTVTEGAVEVAERPSADAQPLVVHAIMKMAEKRVARGEQLSYDDGGSASPVEPGDPRAATAWSKGELEFDHVPLREVVEVLNRYSHRTITVDQSSGEQIFTGLVFQDQIDAWIHQLPGSYSVEVLQHGEEVCVRSTAPTSPRDPSSCGNAP
jgi:transmembrane sensor